MLKNYKAKALSMALFITITNIVGKLLGFLKQILISYYYGANELTDAIFLAMSIPMLILGVFTSSTDGAIMPQYNRILNSKGRDEADKYFSNAVNLILIIAFIASIVIFIVPDSFINIFAPGFNLEQRRYSIQFLRLFSFFGFMHILYCFFSTYNTIHKHIIGRGILSFLTNLTVIIFLILYPDPNMLSLSLAYFLGNMTSAIIPILSAYKSGYKHILKIRLTDEEMFKFIGIFLPVVGVAFLEKLNMYVDRFLASNMRTGSITYIDYAFRFASIFDSILIVGMGVFILPVLSQSRLKNDIKKFSETVFQTLKILVTMLFPIMILSMAMSFPLIEMIYMRGEFGSKDVIIVSKIFFFYAPLILAVPVQAMLIKVFHSIEDTKTPFYVNTFSIVINIVLSIILSKKIGISGIAVATSISVFIGIIILFFKTHKFINWCFSVHRLKDIFKILFSGALLIIYARFSIDWFNDYKNVVRVLFISVTGGLIYISSLVLFMRKDILKMYYFIRK